MKNIYFSLLTLCCFTFLNSCSDAETNSGTDELPGAIALSTNLDLSTSVSRSSIGLFPNNGRIGVTATYYHGGGLDSTNWASYPDIYDDAATAVVGSSNSYTFTWDNLKYYPFDGKQLVFMAYSPPISETSDSFLLSSDGRGVFLKLYEGMPDFMYASANATASTTPHSKSSLQAVDLGEFRHALSKLTVEVVGDVSMNPDVKLTSLSVKTSKRIATFYLPTNTLLDPAEGEYIYTLVSEHTQFSSTDTVRHTVFLFPGTEDVTEISIGLTDNVVFTSHDFMMSFFQNVSNVGQPLLLEQGKNTTLRLRVKGTTVTNMEIELKGTLSDWNQKGNFGITIN